MTLLALLLAQKAEATSFKDASSFVSFTKQNGEVLAYESIADDYNNDGKNDIAVLIHSTNPSRSGYQIAVLIRNSSNTLDLLEMSKFGDSSNGLSAKLKEKRNGSLFVHVDLPSGFSGTYQFKLINNAMTLIGSEIHLSSCKSDQDRCAAVDTSTNFLTGNIVFHKKIIGGKEDINLWSKDKIDPPRCELKNFDFDPYFCVENIKTSNGMLDALMRGEK